MLSGTIAQREMDAHADTRCVAGADLISALMNILVKVAM
jgi:hypothetical protein